MGWCDRSKSLLNAPFFKKTTTKKGGSFGTEAAAAQPQWLLTAADLRLRERGRRLGEQWLPSSSVMLSVLPKCLDKKWSSSMVGWKGS